MLQVSSGHAPPPWPDNQVLTQALHRCLERARLTNSSRRLRSLVMLSGGLDSVALLANVLSQTDHLVHAHHIEIDNFERRAPVENEALERVLASLRKGEREFDTSTSASRFPLGRGGGLDLTLSLFVAARVCVALGGLVDVVFTGHRDRNVSYIREGSAVFDACFINRRRKPLWLRPLEGMSKFDIHASIPPELAELTWSCRKPVYTDDGDHAPCTKCHSCREMAAVRQRLSG